MGELLKKVYLNTVHKFPLIALIALLLTVVAVGSQISKLKFDASSDSLVIEGDKALALYRDVGKRYGAEDFLIVTYTPKGDLFNKMSLDSLQHIESELTALPQVSSVNSIVNVPLLYSPKVTLSNLQEDINYLKDPAVDRGLAKAEFANSPIYKGLLLSEDGKTTVLQVNLKRRIELNQLRESGEALRAKEREGTINPQEAKKLLSVTEQYASASAAAKAEDKQLIENVRSILDKHRSTAQVFLGGVTMIANDMLTFIQQDLSVFGTAIFLFIVLVLGLVFRQLRWVMLPMLACVSCVILTTGFMAMLGWQLTVISANFVALLLILTLSVTVHLVVRYREYEAERRDMTHKERVLATVSSMFRPCLFTTLTTIVAFTSLVFSGIRPVIDFGWMMTLGVIIALLTTFIVLPAGMLLWDKKGAKETDRAAANTPPITQRLAQIVEKFGSLIVGVAVALLGLSLIGVANLKVENRFIDYFDEKTEIYQGMELIDAKLGGVIPLDIILRKTLDDNELEDDFADSDSDFNEEDDFAGMDGVDTKSSYWFTQAGVEDINQLHGFIDGLDETGKTLSLSTMYQVAEDIIGRDLDAIQLSILQNNVSGEMEDALVAPYLESEGAETRLTVRVKETSNTLNRKQLLAKIDNYIQTEMGYDPKDYDLTGLLVLYNNMLQSLFKSQIQTLGAVFIAIMLMFLVLFRSIKISLIAILPNALAAGLVLGCMGLFGIPLDMMTITIAAITIGIGVDNSIHYIYRFKQELANDGNYLATMHRSHTSIGRAMFYTSATIIIGFAILVLSNFTPSIYFGVLTSFAMMSALLGNLLLLPKLLMIFKPFK
ncbi:MAG: MMPL family transporter [Pseudomonadota bacterium]